ncbi:RING-type E3 ubiquitin transferase [Salvia divinorum]|uniref:RING-type E3 ubiquitin transferase n=1 Tax=Salvia divinorum TaxID=28513 RepID=A0ABD1I165_SALDI
MGYYFDPHTFFNTVETSSRPSIFPQLKIKFHFFFQIRYLNYYVNHDITRQRFIEEFPAAEACASATVVVAMGGSLSADHIAMEVSRAVSALIPAANGYRAEDLIDLAIAEVRDSFPGGGTLPKFLNLHVSFNVRVEHRHMYVVDGECPFTIPDAEAAEAIAKEEAEKKLSFLETREEEGEERCCCICLQELKGRSGGGGVERLPCLHLFHGVCIKEWLRKSPTCPLCRYHVCMEIHDSTILC